MKTKDESNPKSQAAVVDLASFRKKKAVDQEFARDRQPLYVSHLTGKATGNPHAKRGETGDFGDRLQRIRTSLEKINRLMGELKKMSSSSSADDTSIKSK